MSLVTNIILSFCNIEEHEVGAEEDEYANVNLINKWLNSEDRSYGELKDVSEYAGGRVCFEAPLFIAGFNFLVKDEFIAFVKSLPWEEPENVQVMIREQEDDKFRIEICNQLQIYHVAWAQGGTHLLEGVIIAQTEADAIRLLELKENDEVEAIREIGVANEGERAGVLARESL